jgi:hypothetical protein
MREEEDAVVWTAEKSERAMGRFECGKSYLGQSMVDIYLAGVGCFSQFLSMGLHRLGSIPIVHPADLSKKVRR